MDQVKLCAGLLALGLTAYCAGVARMTKEMGWHAAWLIGAFTVALVLLSIAS